MHTKEPVIAGTLKQYRGTRHLFRGCRGSGPDYLSGDMYHEIAWKAVNVDMDAIEVAEQAEIDPLSLYQTVYQMYRVVATRSRGANYTDSYLRNWLLQAQN